MFTVVCLHDSCDTLRLASSSYLEFTCSKVDHNVHQENRVRNTVEDDPACGEVVIKERNGHWQNYQVGHQEQQHAEVPVEPGRVRNQAGRQESWRPEAGAGVDDPVANLLLSHPLLHQSFLAAKQLHGQLVVRWCEDVLQLVANPVWFSFTGHRGSGGRNSWG